MSDDVSISIVGNSQELVNALQGAGNAFDSYSQKAQKVAQTNITINQSNQSARNSLLLLAQGFYYGVGGLKSFIELTDKYSNIGDKLKLGFLKVKNEISQVHWSAGLEFKKLKKDLSDFKMEASDAFSKGLGSGLTSLKQLAPSLLEGAGGALVLGTGLAVLAASIAAVIAAIAALSITFGIVIPKLHELALAYEETDRKQKQFTDSASRFHTAKGGSIISDSDIENLKKYAIELSLVTGQSRNLILDLFKSAREGADLNKDQIEEASRAIIGFSNITGKDAKTSMDTFSKALRDPNKNLQTFADMNIRVTSSMLKGLTLDQQRTVIIKELAKQYEGAGSKLSSYGGIIEGISELWKTFEQELGKDISTLALPSLREVYDVLASFVKKAVEINNGLQPILEKLGVKIKPDLQGIKDIIDSYNTENLLIRIENIIDKIEEAKETWDSFKESAQNLADSLQPITDILFLGNRLTEEEMNLLTGFESNWVTVNQKADENTGILNKINSLITTINNTSGSLRKYIDDWIVSARNFQTQLNGLKLPDWIYKPVNIVLNIITRQTTTNEKTEGNVQNLPSQSQKTFDVNTGLASETVSDTDTGLAQNYKGAEGTKNKDYRPADLTQGTSSQPSQGSGTGSGSAQERYENPIFKLVQESIDAWSDYFTDIKDQQEAWKADSDALNDIEKQNLDNMLETGKISYEEYHSKISELNQKSFEDNKAYAKDQINSIEEGKKKVSEAIEKLSSLTAQNNAESFLKAQEEIKKLEELKVTTYKQDLDKQKEIDAQIRELRLINAEGNEEEVKKAQEQIKNYQKQLIALDKQERQLKNKALLDDLKREQEKDNELRLLHKQQMDRNKELMDSFLNSTNSLFEEVGNKQKTFHQAMKETGKNAILMVFDQIELEIKALAVKAGVMNASSAPFPLNIPSILAGAAQVALLTAPLRLLRGAIAGLNESGLVKKHSLIQIAETAPEIALNKSHPETRAYMVDWLTESLQKSRQTGSSSDITNININTKGLIRNQNKIAKDFASEIDRELKHKKSYSIAL